MRRHPGNYLSACNSNEPHSPLNLRWPKAAQWWQWKCLFNFIFLNSRLNLPNDCLLPVALFQESKEWGLRKGLSVTQVCAKLLTLQSSIAEPCSFRGQLAERGQCRGLFNWCSTLDKFPNDAILNIQSFPCELLLLQTDINPESGPQNLCPRPPMMSLEPSQQRSPAYQPLLCEESFSLFKLISLEYQGSPGRSQVWSPYFSHLLMAYWCKAADL